MLTASDLRWMDEQRRRAALHRMLDADARALAGTGTSRAELQKLGDPPPGASFRAPAASPWLPASARLPAPGGRPADR